MTPQKPSKKLKDEPFLKNRREKPRSNIRNNFMGQNETGSNNVQHDNVQSVGFNFLSIALKATTILTDQIATIQNDLHKNLLAAFSGVILVLAFAPFNFSTLAIAAMAIFAFLLFNTKEEGKAFKLGFYFGLGFFLFGIHWIYISIHKYGHASIILSLTITALVIIAMSFIIALQSFSFVKLFKTENSRKFFLAYPAIFVFGEWIRTWLFTGFPWLFIGYSQIDSSFRGIAIVFGIYGVSFATLLFSSFIVRLIVTKNNKERLIITIAAFALWTSSVILIHTNWVRTNKETLLHVKLIQGNIHQEIKWDQSKINTILSTYKYLTNENFVKDSLVVWPEMAIPVFANDIHSFINEINSDAINNNSHIIVGIPTMSPSVHTGEMRFYNSIMTLGTHNFIYSKKYLVPFGEYIPMKKIFRWLERLNIPMSNFSKGDVQQHALMIDNFLVAPFICYEIAYPNSPIRYLPEANLLVTVSDDSWFDTSIASHQHLQIARMRSIETGRYQLFVNNTGITAIINEKGEIVEELPLFVKSTINEVVPLITGSTPWVSYGHYLWIILIFFSY